MTVAKTRAAIRVIETSHPPSYYIPQIDIAAGLLRPATGRSVCEWKGVAQFWDVVVGGEILARAGWSYPDPTPSFVDLKDHVAFYASRFDRCTINGEIVTPQSGPFYGGWITSAVAGPFKGPPGTEYW